MKEGTRKIIKNSSLILLKGLAISGMLIIAGSSPRLTKSIWKQIGHEFKKAKYKRFKKLKNEQWKNSFYYLKRRGLLNVSYKNNQMYIFLTKEGKNIARKTRIDNLEIKKPKRWDRKWRILVFDIQEKDRSKREALRGKLKQLELYKLQKSIWVHPYDFIHEVNELKKFFLFKEGELMTIIADEIENESLIRRHFKLD